MSFYQVWIVRVIIGQNEFGHDLMKLDELVCLNVVELMIDWINLKKLCLEQISPIFYVGIKWQIWVNLILSIFCEIGWMRMLKVCLIKDWLDQFVEIVFGTNFPKLLMMAEIKEP